MKHTNSITEPFKRKISRNLLENICVQIFLLSIGVLMQVRFINNLLRDEPATTLPTAILRSTTIVIFFLVIVTPFFLMVQKVRKRLICDIRYEDDLCILTLLNNQVFKFKISETVVTKTDADWYLNYLVSGRNGLVKGIPVTQSRGYKLKITDRFF